MAMAVAVRAAAVPVVEAAAVATLEAVVRVAAQVAVTEHIPLLAVLTGREFDEEGARWMVEACETMGRPLDAVLQELA